jgi:hypothetical protein
MEHYGGLRQRRDDALVLRSLGRCSSPPALRGKFLARGFPRLPAAARGCIVVTSRCSLNGLGCSRRWQRIAASVVFISAALSTASGNETSAVDFLTKPIDETTLLGAGAPRSRRTARRAGIPRRRGQSGWPQLPRAKRRSGS